MRTKHKAVETKFTRKYTNRTTSDISAANAKSSICSSPTSSDKCSTSPKFEPNLSKYASNAKLKNICSVDKNIKAELSQQQYSAGSKFSFYIGSRLNDKTTDRKLCSNNYGSKYEEYATGTEHTNKHGSKLKVKSAIRCQYKNSKSGFFHQIKRCDAQK